MVKEMDFTFGVNKLYTYSQFAGILLSTRITSYILGLDAIYSILGHDWVKLERNGIETA